MERSSDKLLAHANWQAKEKTPDRAHLFLQFYIFIHLNVFFFVLDSTKRATLIIIVRVVVASSSTGFEREEQHEKKRSFQLQFFPSSKEKSPSPSHTVPAYTEIQAERQLNSTSQFASGNAGHIPREISAVDCRRGPFAVPLKKKFTVDGRTLAKKNYFAKSKCRVDESPGDEKVPERNKRTVIELNVEVQQVANWPGKMWWIM